ncbi:MAG: hypothetical protein K940chlam5_01706 [Candidatus Anoxychlamydiales bacterium]|nr:hypothetical protein [Candidatus Anoxychlamydiales bacterium]
MNAIKKLFSIYLLFFILFSLSVEAREEIILTIPKSGTHYLKIILENITESHVITPTLVDSYIQDYTESRNCKDTIVIGHCEPLMIKKLPNSENLFLLIRDPRDVALSAIDFIDNKGLAVWPSLSTIINYNQWILLSKKEKLLLILEDFYDDRKVTISSLFETAINLCSLKNCLIVKYEQLSPEQNNFVDLFATIKNISSFLGISIDETKAKDVIEKSFRNKNSRTYNKGNAYRYLEEDIEVLDLLESKLKKYIDFFIYSY